MLYLALYNANASAPISIIKKMELRFSHICSLLHVSVQSYRYHLRDALVLTWSAFSKKPLFMRAAVQRAIHLHFKQVKPNSPAFFCRVAVSVVQGHPSTLWSPQKSRPFRDHLDADRHIGTQEKKVSDREE